MLTAVRHTTFACGSFLHDGSPNEVGTYTLEIQCCISFKQWENLDFWVLQGFRWWQIGSLTSSLSSYNSFPFCRISGALLGRSGMEKKRHADRIFRGSQSVSSWSHLQGFTNGAWLIINVVPNTHCYLFQPFPNIVRLISYLEFPS
jgi:hypothetical protein